MKKMIGVFMMISGFALLSGGYFVYSNNAEVNGETEMETLIKAVTADGVFTEKERVLVMEMADKYKMDKRSILVQIKDQITSLGEEAETEIIDQNAKKGLDFEKFIAKKLNKEYFSIKQWAGDKYVDGIYSEKTTEPDLIIEFSHYDYKKVFAVECKYRSKVVDGKIVISYEGQLKRYRKFEKEKEIDVYIALGIGGVASKPDELYLIPLSKLSSHEVSISELNKYKKEVRARFFLDMSTGLLNISYSAKKS